MTRPHKAIDLELTDGMSMFGAIVATLNAVHGATLTRGGLTQPEVNAAADELLAWFENQQQRAAAAVEAAIPKLLTFSTVPDETTLDEWLSNYDARTYPRAGSIVVGIDYGFVEQVPPVDEPGQS
jgi:hypothetical protein